jgi:hypothetical protein
MSDKIIITKVGSVDPVISVKHPLMPSPTPQVSHSGGKRQSRHRTFPKSSLKTARVKPVSDPAKAPPFKKSIRKHTVRLLTEKGMRRHKKTIRRKLSKLSDEKVKHLVMKAGLLKNSNTPPGLMREMLEGGMIAGFISLD